MDKKKQPNSTAFQSRRRRSTQGNSQLSRSLTLDASLHKNFNHEAEDGEATKTLNQETSLERERRKEMAALEKKGNFAATTSAACFLSAILAGAIMSPMIAVLFLPKIRESDTNQKEKTKRIIERATGTWKPCYQLQEMNRESCNHHGNCAENSLTGQRKCKCDDGKEATFCTAQRRSNPCKGVICQNGGTCKKLMGDRTFCLCLLGFEGVNCEKKLTPCNPNPCLNGGTCHDRKWTFACECTLEKAGRLCDRPSSMCSEMADDLRTKCYNGICADLHGGATYTCLYGDGCATELCRTTFNLNAIVEDKANNSNKPEKKLNPCGKDLNYPSSVDRGGKPKYICFKDKDKEIFLGKS